VPRLAAIVLLLGLLAQPVSASAAGRTDRGHATTGRAASATTWRYVAGRAPVVDALGRTWQPEVGARGGTVATMPATVSGTASPQLYRSARVGVGGYALPLAGAGTYAVDLYVAETDGVRAGQRVFDVTAEGNPAAAGIDVARSAGTDAAHHVLFTVPVTDGTLNLAFVARRGTPVVSAIEVSRMSQATSSAHLTWADEFDGSAGTAPDPANWDFDLGVGASPGWGNRELESYTNRPENVSLDGHGALAITARSEQHTGLDGATRDFTSARIKTQKRVTWTYGRVEARIKMPSGRGLWPAFWAVGENVYSVGWPASGEMDIVELLGSDPSTAYGSIHGPSQAGRAFGSSKSVRAATPLSDQFHSYGTLGVPGAVQMLLDGKPYVTYTPADLGPANQWVFDHPFHLILNLAVGGNWPGAPDGSTRFPATMLVDYVRVWS
jgi:beta-glucanase (GH16 family)